jgi:ankyrin repeat protein
VDLGEDVITLDSVLRAVHADYREARDRLAGQFGKAEGELYARKVWEKRRHDLNPWAPEAKFLALVEDHDHAPALEMLQDRQWRLRPPHPTLLGHLIYLATTFPSSDGNWNDNMLTRPEKLARAAGPTGTTGLMAAARAGHGDLVNRLLAKGASLQARNMLGWDPLTFASKAGQTDIIKRFLSEGSNPRAACLLGRTALSHATGSNQADTCRILLADTRTSIDQSDRLGFTALTYALLNRSDDALQVLLEAGADITAKDAAGRELSRILRNERITPSARAQDMLDRAELSHALYIHAGVEPCGRNLLQPDVPTEAIATFTLSRRFEDPLRYTADLLLAERGQHVALSPNSAEARLLEAYARRDSHCARRIIIEEQPDLTARDSRGLTLAFHAALRHDSAMISFLGNLGPTTKCGVNTPNFAGQTPLMEIARRGDIALTRQFLAMKADPTCCDARQCSARDYAVAGRFTALAQELEQAEQRWASPAPAAVP